MLFILQNISDLIYAIWLQRWLEDNKSPVVEVLQSLIHCLVLEIISVLQTTPIFVLETKEATSYFPCFCSLGWALLDALLLLVEARARLPKMDQMTQVFALESGLLARRPGKDVSWKVLSLFPKPSLDYFITFHSGWTYCMVADFPRRRWSR